MKTHVNNIFMKSFTLSLAFILILSSFFPTASAFTAPRVTKIETTNSVTVTINDEIDKRSIDTIPLINQMDYDDVLLGPTYTIAEHGCGIACLSMIATYMMDEFVSPVDLAKKYGGLTAKKGTLLILFAVAAEEMGLTMDMSSLAHGEWYDYSDWDRVLAAIKNNQPVIALYRGDSLFSDGGHFVVITGITEDGKFMVNDPNGYNWTKAGLVEGFTNGFTERQIRNSVVCYWIYSTKEEYKASLAENAELEP